MDEQTRRFEARIRDARKLWKLSPMDLESHRRWYDYSRARDAMFAATDTDFSPWYVVNADDKRRARLNCIAHLLSQISYEDVPMAKVKLPEAAKKQWLRRARAPLPLRARAILRQGRMKTRMNDVFTEGH